MKTQNIIMTSVLALVIATPAMAAVGDVITTGASCTIGDLGVSSGTANATAQFEPNTYVCPAGTYLPANGIACTACTDGNFCPGAVSCADDWGECDDPFYTFNEDDDQGLISCEGFAPEGYTSSGAGATSYNACYMAVSCPTITGNSACGPHTTGCAYTNPNATSGNIYADGSLTANCGLTYSCAQGYTSQSIDAPTLPSTSTRGNGYQYRSHNGQNNSNNDNDLSAGEWKVTWNGSGTMKGIASCNAVPGDSSNSWANASTLPSGTDLISNSADANDSNRRYCWCKPTSWTASGGTTTELSAAWVFNSASGDASYCASNCAFRCASHVNNNAAFRSALFGVVGAMSQCVANTIQLRWHDEDGTTLNGVEPTSCTYDESLSTPAAADQPTKRGYTFTGWKFVAPQN